LASAEASEQAHIRDIKDRAFAICAIAANRLTFLEFFGIKEGLVMSDEWANETREHRMKVSNRIRHEFISKSSGLSPSDQELLIKWDDLFHLEVHNGF
jgi:hypothetical protein